MCRAEKVTDGVVPTTDQWSQPLHYWSGLVSALFTLGFLDLNSSLHTAMFMCEDTRYEAIELLSLARHHRHTLKFCLLCIRVNLDVG